MRLSRAPDKRIYLESIVIWSSAGLAVDDQSGLPGIIFVNVPAAGTSFRCASTSNTYAAQLARGSSHRSLARWWASFQHDGDVPAVGPTMVHTLGSMWD